APAGPPALGCPGEAGQKPALSRNCSAPRPLSPGRRRRARSPAPRKRRTPSREREKATLVQTAAGVGTHPPDSPGPRPAAGPPGSGVPAATPRGASASGAPADLSGHQPEGAAARRGPLARGARLFGALTLL